MKPSKPPGGKCPLDSDGDACQIQCKYNYFQTDELTIDAYELKCLNCGWRETIGYRSDELADEPDDLNTKQCPFCNECDLKPGIDPCSNR